jgi:hypothetical protein
MSPNVPRKHASNTELLARKGRSIDVNKLVTVIQQQNMHISASPGRVQ